MAFMNSSTLVNCTPHPVTVYDEKGENVVTMFPCSKYIAGLKSKPQEVIGSIRLDNTRTTSVYTPQVFQEEVVLPTVGEDSCSSIIVSLVMDKHLRKYES